MILQCLQQKLLRFDVYDYVSHTYTKERRENGADPCAELFWHIVKAMRKAAHKLLYPPVVQIEIFYSGVHVIIEYVMTSLSSSNAYGLQFVLHHASTCPLK